MRHVIGIALTTTVTGTAMAADLSVTPPPPGRGGWCTIIGTPKGRNEFFRIYEEALADPERWFSLKLKTSESGILPEHELADLRHMYRETPEA